MRLVVRMIIICLAVGTLSSCVSKKKYDELAASKAATDQALAETQANLKTLQSEKDALAAQMESEKARLNGEISSIRTELNATKGQVAQVQEKLNMTQAELDKLKAEINGIFAAYSNSGLTLEDRDGRLYVVTNTPVKFRSGSSALTKEQRTALDALAEKLKANPAVKILVEGHTDNKQFKADSGMDNWDLSVSRAKSVVKHLVRQGVDPKQLTIAGRGEFNPAADNSTEEGRTENRRTVVAPNPDLGTLKKGN